MIVSNSRPRFIVRPQRVLWIALFGFIFIARSTGAITVKGYCPEHDVEFDLPPRTEAPLFVKCPKGGEKIRRSIAIINYIKHKRGER